MYRRSLLVATTVGLGGCLGIGSSGSSTPEETPDQTDRQPSTRSLTSFTARFHHQLVMGDLSVDVVREEGQRAVLRYHLTDPTVDALTRTLTEVARRFRGIVFTGWDVNRLDVTVANTDGERVAFYHIRSRWAQQFNSDVLSQQEYLNRITNTVLIYANEISTPTPTEVPTPTPTPQPTTTGPSQDSFAVEIVYDHAWAGSMVITLDDGSDSNQSIGGNGPKTIPIDQTGVQIISFNAQKQDNSSDRLIGRILRNGEVVVEETTTAAYGVIQLSHSFA